MQWPFRYEPPPPGPQSLLRPRLLAVLRRRFDVRLLTVEAGAGFGKTTLLAQAILENRLDATGRDLWLSCDSSDSSSSSFLDGLLRSTGAEPPGRTTTTVDDVAARLWMLTPERVCLIVDDAHLLAPGSSGEAALVALAEALPANAGLVVGSRRPVPVRRSRLELQHQALAISEADLRLDNDELTELAHLRGWDPAALSGVGGWPALAEMVAASGVDGASRFVHEEVLARLDPELQRAFLAAVAIGATDRALLEAAIGKPVDIEALAAVPLVTFDRAVGIRPHQLWAELLKAELAAAEIAAIRFRAAQRLRDAEQFGVAFELLAAAGEWDQAISVIVPACNDQRHPPWPDVLARWRQLVPSELVHSPEVIYLDAMIERAADPWSPRCRDAFRQSIRAFHHAGRQAEALSCSVRASYSNWLRADLPAIERDHAVALEATEQGALSVAVVHANEAMQADIRGDGPRLRRAAAGTRDTEPRLRHFTGYHRVVADLYDGTLGAPARTAAAESAASADAVFPAAGTGWAFGLGALVDWATGRLPSHEDRALTDPGPRISLAERVPQVAAAAIIAAHRGDITSALDSLAEVDIIVPEIGTRDLLAGYRAVAVATIAAARGHEEEAASALAAGLADRELGPSQAGRALLWFPSVAYLVDERCRRWLDRWPTGPQRLLTLAPARALLALRAGTPTDIELPPSAEALLTRLPVRQAIELLVRLDAAGRRVEPLMQTMCELAPAPARDALNQLEHQHPTLRKSAAALRGTVPIPPPVGLAIDVLGPMRLRRGGVLVDDRDWQRERVRQMVAVLIGHRQLRRQRLGALLWPEFDEDGVSANLRMTLSYVQGIFEPHRAKGDAPWYLHQAAGVLTLRDDATITVDAWEVERLLDQADDAGAAGIPSQQLNHLLAALALWRGDYLDDVAGQDWAEPLRRRLSERLVNAAVRAAELLVGAGRADEAARAAERAIAADSWAEDAYRALARAQYAQGNRVGAQRTLERARAALAELGLDLSPATVEMAERMTRSG